MLETIGPVWDGNEVWLVVAGGATFAAFPAWYATMFSGFYLALLLDARPADRPRGLVRVARASATPALAGRLAVGEHDRKHRRARSSGAWRSRTSSTASRWTPTHDFTGDFLDLFSPYTVVAGLAVVACSRSTARRS